MPTNLWVSILSAAKKPASLSSCDENLPLVREMVDASTPVEIILDSGADVDMAMLELDGTA